MFESLDPKTRMRIERRYAELQIDPEAFIRRFDLDGDGTLNEDEQRAARSILAEELLREESLSNSLSDTDLLPGMTLRGRYIVLAEIGNGAQGIAYAARDKTNQNIVVIKQLRLSHMDAWEAYDAFRREAEVLSRLSHPRLPRFIEVFQIEENSKHFYFSVQSLMPGRNLADRQKSGELFSEEDLVSIAAQCLEILHYLHRSAPALLHRDIKPSNLLLDDYGKLYLVDFGAVQYVKASKTMAVGTAGYMATEQLIGSARPQSDLYSLGATLVRLATKIHPYDLELERMRMIWRPFASLSPNFSDWIDTLIDPEFEDRFESAYVAKSFLDSGQSIDLRKEANDVSDLSMRLVEQFENKPKLTEVRIWESVDQFVCTFPASDFRGLALSDAFAAMMKKLFRTKNYKELSRHGGGFSFEENGKCVVSVKTDDAHRSLMYRKLIGIENTIFDDGDYGILGIYGSTGQSKRLKSNTSVALAVGLDKEVAEWVWQRLSNFLSSHQQYLM